MIDIYRSGTVAANTFVNNALTAAVSDQHSVLSVTITQLHLFIHNRLQQALLQLSGQDIVFVWSSITEWWIASHHQLYVNVLLIQSQSQIANLLCAACCGCWDLFSFLKCHRVSGHFDSCCSNCKWSDHGICCSVWNEASVSDSELFLNKNDSESLWESFSDSSFMTRAGAAALAITTTANFAVMIQN